MRNSITKVASIKSLMLILMGLLFNFAMTACSPIEDSESKTEAKKGKICIKDSCNDWNALDACTGIPQGCCRPYATRYYAYDVYSKKACSLQCWEAENTCIYDGPGH